MKYLYFYLSVLVRVCEGGGEGAFLGALGLHCRGGGKSEPLQQAPSPSSYHFSNTNNTKKKKEIKEKIIDAV